MEWLTAGLGAVLSGGATSLIGIGAQIFADYKKKQQANQHELDMADKQAAQMKAELEIAKYKGEVALETAIETGHDTTLAAAIDAQSESVKGASPWVIDACAMTRPVLTVLLVLVAFGVAFLKIPPAMQASFLYMATTAVLFWFGDRMRQKRVR